MVILGVKRYLDPKNDLVFRKVFGQHPIVLRAFLNAVLPLAPEEKIVELEYLPNDQVPEIPLLKHTIVDVRCRDQKGRQFIVEMQMQWTTAFMQRVFFNASKAYVRQLERGEQYELLQPVIGLSLLNDVFEKEKSDYYHHYKMVNVKSVDKEIEGLQLVFIELPKVSIPVFQNEQEAWLRYLIETGRQETAPEELSQRTPELAQALDLAELAAFTAQELASYERYWDAVSTEKTLVSGKLAEGEARGLAKGRVEGRAEGRAEGLTEALEKLISSGMSEGQARAILGL